MQTEFLMNVSLQRKRHEEPCKRSGHVAVHYNAGCMLVWGGLCRLNRDERQTDINAPMGTGQDCYINGNEVWCLDIEAQKWQKWTSTQSFDTTNNGGMSGSCATCVGHMMYIIGGHMRNGNSNELLRFDIRRKSWTRLQPGGTKPSPRDKFICWQYENKIIIFGGFGPPSDRETEVKGDWVADPSTVQFYEDGVEVRGWNNHVFVYNISTNTWSQPTIEGTPPRPRASQAGCVIGERGYVFGGRCSDARRNDMHYLDLKNMRWSGMLDVHSDIPEGRSWHGMAACSDRHLLVYGGFSSAKVTMGDAWVFDTLSERWTQLEQSTEKPRLWHTLVSTHSPGEVIAFGGCTNNILDPDQYDIETNEVVSFFFSPKSLSRLCTEAVAHYQDILGQHIAILPKFLIARVEDFMQDLPPNDLHRHSYNLRSRHGEDQRPEAMDER